MATASIAEPIASVRPSAIATELIVRHDERRTEQDRIAIDAVREARPAVEQQARVSGIPDDRLGQPGGSWERLAALEIRDELDPDHEAAAADLADVRVAGETLVEQGPEPFALDPRRLDERLRLDDAEHFARDRGGNDVVAVGEAMDEGAGSEDRLDDGSGRGSEAERPVARRGAFRRDEDVGSDAPVVDSEPAAGAAETGHHLVGDKQYAVSPADISDGRPVVIGRDSGAQRRADDGLGDERGDRPRARLVDRPVELGRQLVGRAEGVGAGVARTVGVGRADMAEPAEPGFVWPAKRAAA